MALRPGTRIGSFTIETPLGAGGMGEVYRARDSRLGRSVALKVLSDGFTFDGEHLDRLMREAQLLASLNHPNIAAIYGVEEAEGVRALVLELIDGPTLAERIALGTIPWREALAIARQIAVALEAAHDHAIVHRDLKPANVKPTHEGTVKVLDFGLAKALNPNAAVFVADPAKSPTLTVHSTQVGVILGTAAYMAPEQARGRAVDRRADIWAFGVVLYEMLTGKPPFGGEGIADVLAKVLESEPDWESLPLDTPSGIRRLLQRCLRRIHAGG
jgi:eukaryotic-like serine/threonine-protein kinase